MIISLNGIKSTGMHPEVQRPAKWRRGGCDRERSETSGSLFEIGRAVAEVGPIDIGAEFFAANSAIGCFLDRWAMLGWYFPDAVFPLRDNGWSDANGCR